MNATQAEQLRAELAELDAKLAQVSPSGEASRLLEARAVEIEKLLRADAGSGVPGDAWGVYTPEPED